MSYNIKYNELHLPIEHAVVKFTEKAFINPATYTNTPDTSLTAYGYRVYMEAKDQNDHRDLKVIC